MTNQPDTKEMVDVIDEDENIVNTVPRNIISEKLLLHKSVNILVYNKFGKLLIHKRTPNKEVNPDTWDFRICGCVKSGENPIKAATREVVEEIGAKNIKLKFLKKFQYKSENTNDIVYAYKTEYNGEIIMAPDEVAEFEWIESSDLLELMDERKFGVNNYSIIEEHGEDLIDLL